MWLFYYSNFKRNYDILKSKSPLNKNINFNKSKTESKIENPTQFLRDEHTFETKIIISYTFLLILKIVESLQCILQDKKVTYHLNYE